MEKSKKSQSGKSLFKNSISSIKFDLKNFQNVFVISVFLVFIFIMAATAISVWISKQAEPPTVEEYCANCRVFDVQQENINLLKSPSTSLPVLRIFGKDIQVCHQACQNLRPIFNIQFECVPMALASKETIKEVYMAFDLLAQDSVLVKDGSILTKNKLAEKELNEGEQEQKYIIFSSATQVKVKMANKEKEIEKEIAPIYQDKKINQKKADQAMANLFLELDPRTVFFIGGHILTFDGIPNKDNICEVVDDPACPLKNSSFIPKENFFGLIKNCYALPSATTNHSSHWGGNRPSATTNHSSHWGGNRPSAINALLLSANFFSSGINWDSLTLNADGSISIGGGGPSQSAIDTAIGFVTGSGATYTTTGGWLDGIFNIGGLFSTGTTGFDTEIIIGGNNSECNIAIGHSGFTFNTPDLIIDSSELIDTEFDSEIISAMGLSEEEAESLTATLNNLTTIALSNSDEILAGAINNEYAWTAQLIADPNQNLNWALTQGGGVDITTNVQVLATIEDGELVSAGSSTDICLGDCSWNTYFYSGSPDTITTSDGTWELGMLTRTTRDGSLEFLAYDATAIVYNEDGTTTTGALVSYDPADPNANEIAYGYQLVVNEPAGTSGVSGTSGTSGTSGISGVPGVPVIPPIIPPANRAPSAAIGCYPSCEITTGETSSFSLRENHGDPDGDPVTCNWTIDKCQNSSCSIKVNFLNSNVCSDLSSPVSQVGHYQARFVVNDGEFSVYAVPNPLDFYILQEITAGFHTEDSEGESTWDFIQRETVYFINDSAATSTYNINNWNWKYEYDEDSAISGTFSGENPSFTFTDSGKVNITLTVTDTSSRSASIEHSINIKIPMPNWKEVHPGE